MDNETGLLIVGALNKLNMGINVIELFLFLLLFKDMSGSSILQEIADHLRGKR